MALADLSFDKGHDFEAFIWDKLKLPVNFMEDQGLREFFLVVEFTRSEIRLNEESVGTILLYCFGGRASLFRVSRLQNWTFGFSVSSKDVGFAIYNGGNISLPLFNLSFWLWNSGGPNYKREYALFLQEREKEWTVVS